MWRLTDEAIREGVKSTTRYRSKQPNKRGHRTQQPQPQRQASGAKGGQAARRSARMKRSGRMQDTSHVPCPQHSIRPTTVQTPRYPTHLLRTTEAKWTLATPPEMTTLVASLYSDMLILISFRQQGRTQGVLYRKACQSRTQLMYLIRVRLRACLQTALVLALTSRKHLWTKAGRKM